MMKFNNIVFVFSIFILGCDSNKKAPSIQSNGELVIVDSSDVKTNLLLYTNNHRNGYYPVYYLGKFSDTIRLGNRTIPKYEVDSEKHSRLEDFTSPDSIKMRIIVDTTFSLSYTEFYEKFDEKQKRNVVDSTKSYKAIPILIYNQSNSIIPVGWSNKVGYMVRQIKNDKGEWIDIETPIDYYCLTGARLLIIEPKQMMVAKLIRHNGNVQAICRLKFANFGGTVYSNTFIDFIDKHDKRKSESM